AVDSLRPRDFACRGIAAGRDAGPGRKPRGGRMQYVCDGPGGKTWFRIETEAEAVAESEEMRHAVEKYFRKEQDKAAQSFRPISKVYFEQEIGLKAHIQREMPLFLTLREMDGTP